MEMREVCVSVREETESDVRQSSAELLVRRGAFAGVKEEEEEEAEDERWRVNVKPRSATMSDGCV